MFPSRYRSWSLKKTIKISVFEPFAIDSMEMIPGNNITIMLIIFMGRLVVTEVQFDPLLQEIH